jgi:hypothetical protein
MASGTTELADIVIPEVFTPYVQQLTEEKSRLIQSGAVVTDQVIDNFLVGGGATFNIPSFKDLDNDADNVSTDNPASLSTPNKIGTATEIGVRLDRNNSWSSMDLAAALAGKDPMVAIADRVAYYWTRRLQALFVAILKGVIADNTANDSGDYSNDVSGVGFVDGVTNFSTEAFIDTALTMGDSMEDLTMLMVHSVVYARMQKNNLIDFIPDARGEVNIPTFLGRQVIIDDGMPRTGSVYDSWLFRAGAVRMGRADPKVPTETFRAPSAGNGGGQDTLYNRVAWCLHPAGHAYIGTPPTGGPSNANTSNNLAAAGSWNRVFSERKQIKFARLVTREA